MANICTWIVNGLCIDGKISTGWIHILIHMYFYVYIYIYVFIDFFFAGREWMWMVKRWLRNGGLIGNGLMAMAGVKAVDIHLPKVSTSGLVDTPSNNWGESKGMSQRLPTNHCTSWFLYLFHKAFSYRTTKYWCFVNRFEYRWIYLDNTNVISCG